jgi:hypothetical protein
MSNEIKTSEGRVVGSWDGVSAKAFMDELMRIRNELAAAGKGEKLQPKEMPHRDQLPADLHQFKAYPLWGCDKSGMCVVGAGANRLEPTEKVLAFSLVEHH